MRPSDTIWSVQLGQVMETNWQKQLSRSSFRIDDNPISVADVEEGALLPSPTREKLMPVLPRSKTGSPQRGSPQKTISSRHGSPMKGSPQKSPKKISKGKLAIIRLNYVTFSRHFSGTISIRWSNCDGQRLAEEAAEAHERVGHRGHHLVGGEAIQEDAGVNPNCHCRPPAETK